MTFANCELSFGTPNTRKEDIVYLRFINFEETKLKTNFEKFQTKLHIIR